MARRNDQPTVAKIEDLKFLYIRIPGFTGRASDKVIRRDTRYAAVMATIIRIYGEERPANR